MLRFIGRGHNAVAKLFFLIGLTVVLMSAFCLHTTSNPPKKAATPLLTVTKAVAAIDTEEPLKVFIPAVISAPTPVPSPSPVPTPTQPAFLARCLGVPTDMIDAIATGLLPETGTRLDPQTAQAVKSGDFANVFFIAAQIVGPGMGGGPWIGVWASNSLEPGKGLIFAIDGFAHQFSDWGVGNRRTDVQISMGDDGAQDALDCTRNKLGAHP